MNEIPLTTQEVADLLNVRRTTLEAWRSRGGGPKFMKLGRVVRYRRRDVDQWLEENTHTSTSEVA